VYLIVEEAYLEDVSVFVAAFSHAQVPQSVSHEDHVVPMHQLLKVVRIVDGVLVLVESVDQLSLEAHQCALQRVE
jgi:hypothetical protein